ncbi:MAG: xanthine dehydrogenase accessory protein XdhC [Sneathiella sp.]|nr:xanthine dehydrogenase accessory protein XdhC [Sneathiella sp.]
MTSWRDIKLDMEAHTDAPALLVTILTAKGSTPRELGAKMLVYPDRIYGSIGGGRLEELAIQKSRERLKAKEFKGELHSLPLGPELAQCCGGYVDLLISKTPAIQKAKTIITHWDGVTASFDFTDEMNNSIDRVELDQKVSLSTPYHNTDFTLAVYGAGHVGKAIINAVSPLNCDIHWIDNRADEFPGTIPTNTQKHLCRDPKTVVGEIPNHAFHLVLTHDHQLDLEIVAEILRSGSARFIGLIGSKTKWARFQKQLAQMGFSKQQIASVTCPIGLPELEGKKPAEIAISVAADILRRSQRSKRLYNNDNSHNESLNLTGESISH